MIVTCHMRHSFMPINQTNKNVFISCNNLLTEHFNPIQQNEVIAHKRQLVGLLQQSIPFLVAILYIMIHLSSSPSEIYRQISTEKSLPLHTIILVNKNKQRNSLSDISIEYIFYKRRLGI